MPGMHTLARTDHEHGVLDLVPARHAGPGFRLVEGDSLEVLARLPPASVDLIFADPPYNLSNGGTTCQSGRRAAVHKGDWDASRGVEHDHAFHRAWLEACRRVLKPTGTLWVSGTQHVIFSLGYAMQEIGYHLLNTVSWYKPNASPNLACRMFTHSTELLIWAAPSRGKKLEHTFHYRAMKAQNGGKQMRDVWPLPANDGDDGDDRGDVWTLPTPAPSEKRHGRHPTQKPLALLDRIVEASSDPGGLVVDPFNGSGTTGLAATRAGRRYLGIDLDPAYLDLTRRRLADAP
jgi:site-specific DNA-methyltransferase (adenine-specific)